MRISEESQDIAGPEWQPRMDGCWGIGLERMREFFMESAKTEGDHWAFQLRAGWEKEGRAIYDAPIDDSENPQPAKEGGQGEDCAILG